ncbi:MAG: hypothetical protein ACRDKF_02155 [Actinomycetota bacterium]
MRPSGFALAIAIIGASLTIQVSSSKAGCVGPEVEIDRRSARPGETILVTGRYWFDGCNDTGGSSCFGPAREETETPTEGIDIEIKRRGGSEWKRLVENVDADEDFRIRSQIEVPNLKPGRYVILVHDRGNDGYPRLKLRIL